jgi:hypothetical protein
MAEARHRLHRTPLVHERGRSQRHATGWWRQERVDEDQRGDLAVRSVSDHGQQHACTAVTDEDDALVTMTRRPPHRIRDVTPPRLGRRGNA